MYRAADQPRIVRDLGLDGFGGTLEVIPIHPPTGGALEEELMIGQRVFCWGALEAVSSAVRFREDVSLIGAGHLFSSGVGNEWSDGSPRSHLGKGLVVVVERFRQFRHLVQVVIAVVAGNVMARGGLDELHGVGGAGIGIGKEPRQPGGGLIKQVGIRQFGIVRSVDPLGYMFDFDPVGLLLVVEAAVPLFGISRRKLRIGIRIGVVIIISIIIVIIIIVAF
mmetsp:Transcript_6438/g.15443  ORF Transcript_6438/g.15443 Transcript_6438/m.15443 type:complete len:222 (-) Transcript_6438:95-760(-)